MRKILVTGDRNWTNRRTIEIALAHWTMDNFLEGQGSVNAKPLPAEQVTIIHGAARGADTIADSVAKDFHFNCGAYPALWEKFGKGAGPIRNREMLDQNPDVFVVLAFHDKLDESTGTLHMSRYAATKGKPVWVYHSDGTSYQFIGERRFLWRR